MFDTYEEFNAVIDRAQTVFLPKVRAALMDEFATTVESDVGVDFKRAELKGIEIDVVAGVPPDQVSAHWCIPYDEALWDHELKKLLFVVRRCRET